MAGVRPEPVADVDHRGRTRGGQGSARRQPRAGVELVGEQALDRDGGQPDGLPNPPSSFSAAAPPPSWPVTATTSPGCAPRARDERRPGTLVADARDREQELRRAHEVAAGHADPVAQGDLRQAVGDPQQRLVVLARRGAEDDVGLPGLRPHRGQVRQRGGQGLAADRLGRELGPREVHSLDHRVNRDGARRLGRLGDGGVVAAGDAQARAGRREPLDHPRDQVELAAGHGCRLDD